MRSTVVLDDELAKKAKQRALEQGSTLSDVINDALREALSSRVTLKAPPFALPTFGDPSRIIHREPADFAELQTDDDVATLAR